jgi:hypothetical protein
MDNRPSRDRPTRRRAGRNICVPADEGSDRGASPDRREVHGVLNELKAVERSLNKSDVAFLRAEFLFYFE